MICLKCGVNTECKTEESKLCVQYVIDTELLYDLHFPVALK